jgi:hypothetical protein
VYKRYVVRLTNEERKGLEILVRRGSRAHAHKLLYARILLKPMPRREVLPGPTCAWPTP